MTEKTNAIQNSAESMYEKIALLLDSARSKVVSLVNTTMVRTYFEIGRIIVEEEQKGKARAEYGKETLKRLSSKLTARFGKGFSLTNLKQMRDFYRVYSIGQTVSDEFRLSWSHYLLLMRMETSGKLIKNGTLDWVTLAEVRTCPLLQLYNTINATIVNKIEALSFFKTEQKYHLLRLVKEKKYCSFLCSIFIANQG